MLGCALPRCGGGCTPHGEAHARAHEVGVILHPGLKRMVEKQDNVYYYITLLNENYAMPGLTAGTQEQIIKGMYRARGQSGRGDCQVRHSDRQGQSPPATPV